MLAPIITFGLVLIGIIYFIVWFVKNKMWICRADLLNSKFRNMGTLVGKSKKQIVEVVGLPQVVSRVESGQISYIASWKAGDGFEKRFYTITLSFDYDNICVGIVDESFVCI